MFRQRPILTAKPPICNKVCSCVAGFWGWAKTRPTVDDPGADKTRGVFRPCKGARSTQPDQHRTTQGKVRHRPRKWVNPTCDSAHCQRPYEAVRQVAQPKKKPQPFSAEKECANPPRKSDIRHRISKTALQALKWGLTLWDIRTLG